jgi:hypothetical protein
VRVALFARRAFRSSIQHSEPGLAMCCLVRGAPRGQLAAKQVLKSGFSAHLCCPVPVPAPRRRKQRRAATAAGSAYEDDDVTVVKVRRGLKFEF